MSQEPIFGLGQIARAVDLGLGIDSPEKIEIIAKDRESQACTDAIRRILESGCRATSSTL